MSEITHLASNIDALATPASTCVVLSEGMSAATVLRLHRMLQELGFRVVCSDSPQAALQMCTGRQTGLVIGAATDSARLLLSRLNGKAGEWRPRFLVVLPRDAGPEDVLEMLMAGADECLTWPFSSVQLAQRLSHLLQTA